MTTVEFHTGVEDVLDFSCRLLRKAYRRGATVLCVAPRDTLEALDRALWTFDERDFVPHLRLDAAAGAQTNALAARTPIWLAEHPPTGGTRDVMLSVAGTQVAAATDYARVIEVVAASPEQAERGRELWRQYRLAGIEIVHHASGSAREG